MARKVAEAHGLIISYKVMALSKNADRHVVLMTEHSDTLKFDAREGNFRKAIKEIRNGAGHLLINGLGSKDMAEVRFSETLTAVPHDGQ